ncbi:hypothetical protein, partial [Promineifilum sp.]|uniref:hypothetical protein n=1 Tax=Promineifilum sp. TaxID=2664178 RepID=UPI0035AEEC66
ALEAELKRAPAERAREAEAVAARLARLTAALEAGDAEMADAGGRALERAAEALADARPGIPAAARQITAATRRIMN